MVFYLQPGFNCFLGHSVAVMFALEWVEEKVLFSEQSIRQNNYKLTQTLSTNEPEHTKCKRIGLV